MEWSSWPSRESLSQPGAIDTADPAANIKLTGGEEVRVPEAGRIFVVGNVKKPGAFAVRDGAETSVLDWRDKLVCSRCGSRDVDMVVSGTERR